MHEEGNKIRKLMVVVAAVLCGSFLFAADFERGTMVYVAEKTVKFKSSTGLFAKTVATVSYGDIVTIVEGGAKFSRVEFGEATGWIKNTALSAQQVVTENNPTVRQSAEELARAAKEAATTTADSAKDALSSASDSLKKVGEESSKAADEVKGAATDIAGRLKEAVQGIKAAFSGSEQGE